MLYVSYLVPASRVAPFLTALLRAAVADGERVFFTLVIFRGMTSGAATLPTPRIPFDQVNIRTYVLDPVTGRLAVYFLRCGITGGLSPTPWQSAYYVYVGKQFRLSEGSTAKEQGWGRLTLSRPR